MKKRNKTVAVIGAGLGGVSTALYLAAEGFDVTIFEKNDHVGGKLNVLKKDGFSFDLGPSILTLPHYFESLFQKCGATLSDYVSLVQVSPHWRNFFVDGTVFDLHQDKEAMSSEILRLPKSSAEDVDEFFAFLEYAKEQYRIVEDGYFAHGLDNFWQFLNYYGFFKLAFKIDYRKSMAESIEARLRNPYVKRVFEYFIKYVGSSAYKAPGFMNLMPTIQFEYGLWYVDGGLSRLADALTKLLEKMKVQVSLQSRISKIIRSGSKVTGLVVNNGENYNFDYIVSNMEVIPAESELLGADSGRLKKLEKFEPACSGLVLHIASKKEYPQLAHHNFFYSADQRKHFHEVFELKQLPSDPTIYLVAPSRTDKTQAPEGCENIKILPHIPYINEESPLSEKDYAAFKELVLDKLEAMGLKDLRKNTLFENMWTPFDIKEKYLSNKGSIYGVASDWKKNFGFKAPKKSSEYDNLFFVGGSVNPGGGMPMVVLCGQNVGKSIVKQEEQRV